MNEELIKIRPHVSEGEINDMIEKAARFIAERHLALAVKGFIEHCQFLNSLFRGNIPCASPITIWET
jgi:hypothetical protein